MDDNNYLEKTVMRRWEFLTGDVDFSEYGGKWYKQISDNVYHVIELINMLDACGNDADNMYHVNLQEINLKWVNMEEVMSSMGYSEDVNVDNPLIQVESISTYGNYAPMGNYDGNNYRKLLANAKRESKQLENDHLYHELQLAQPVNRLGSTACEYAHGDFTSAMLRGISQDNPSAKIIGKMHGLSSEDMEDVKGQFDDFSMTCHHE